MNFENLLLPIPFEAEKYLSLRYGSDFMKIPNSDILQNILFMQFLLIYIMIIQFIKTSLILNYLSFS